MKKFPNKIVYSKKIQKGEYQYRKVILTQELFQKIEGRGIMKQTQWRALGIEGSLGWEHYKYDPSYPHVLIFRKLKGKSLFESTSSAFVGKYIKSHLKESKDYETVCFKREDDKLVIQRRISQEEENIGANDDQNKQTQNQSFEVPQIKLFGRSSSASSAKTLQTLTQELINRNPMRRDARQSSLMSGRASQERFLRISQISPIEKHNRTLKCQNSFEKKQIPNDLNQKKLNDPTSTKPSHSFKPSILEFRQNNPHKVRHQSIPSKPVSRPKDPKHSHIIPLWQILMDLQRK